MTRTTPLHGFQREEDCRLLGELRAENAALGSMSMTPRRGACNDISKRHVALFPSGPSTLSPSSMGQATMAPLVGPECASDVALV